MSHTNENVIPPPADLRDSPSPSPSENEILPSYEELSAISSDLNSPRRSSAEQIKLYNGVEMKISISGNKTYRPGDTIHGSAILHNHNSEPLSIDGVLISLIGLQTVTNMRNPIKPITVNQKIIDMADTETFNETKNLTLRPNETLERPFAFVVPQYILDTYCPHQIADHLHIPPSFDGDEGRSVYGQKIVYKIRAEIDPVNLFVLEKVYICSDHTAFPKSSHSSTVDQLKLAEKYAEKEIETTSYKINLRNLGIRSINEQNDLIHHDLMTKNKSEFQDFMKLDSPTSEKLEFLVSNEVSSTIDMPRKSSSGLFNFSKQETDKVYIVIDGDSHLVGSKIDVKLFTFAEKPPAIEMLKFQPILYSVNYQSSYPIPVKFDDSFLLSDGFSAENLLRIREYFADKFRKLERNYKFLALQNVESHELQICKSLSSLYSSMFKDESFFKATTFVHPKWQRVLVNNTPRWEISTQIDLSSESKSYGRNFILPFQNCRFGRQYFYNLKLSTSQNKSWDLEGTFIPHFHFTSQQDNSFISNTPKTLVKHSKTTVN